AADANTLSRATDSSVRSAQCPMKRCSTSALLELVERHDHVRKCGHERLRFTGNRRASNRWRSIVDAQRTVLGEERRDAFGILAAPSCCVGGCESVWIGEIHLRI